VTTNYDRDLFAQKDATIATLTERVRAQTALIAELRAALAAVVGEADFVLRGGDCPEETCQECGLYGVGMLRDALNPARALLERTKP